MFFSKEKLNEFNLWKCIDDIDCTSQGFSMILFEKIEEFENSLSEKFEKQPKPKQWMWLSGGNYTCDIFLPYMLKRIQKHFPQHKFKLGLAEIGNYKGLAEIEQEIILSGHYKNSNIFEMRKAAKDSGYYMDRSYFFKDKAFIAGPSALVKNPNDKIHMLSKFPLLKGRYFRDSSMKNIITVKYRLTPRGREKEDPFLVSDKFYYSYILMRHQIGLWITFDSAPIDKEVVKLENIEKSELERKVIFKKEYWRIGMVVKKQVQNFMRNEYKIHKNNKQTTYWVGCGLNNLEFYK